jgi:hypothetical protein
MKEINSIIAYFRGQIDEAISETRPTHYVPKWKIKQIQDQLANALKVRDRHQSAIDIFNSIQEVK